MDGVLTVTEDPFGQPPVVTVNGAKSDMVLSPVTVKPAVTVTSQAESADSKSDSAGEVDNSTVNTPSPHTPHPLTTAGRWALRGGRYVWRGPETASFWLWRAAARRPRLATGGVLAAVTATPVTWSHVTGGVVLTAATLALSADARDLASSLQDEARAARAIRRIKRRWVTVCTDVGLAKPGATTGTKRVPRIVSARATNVGVQLRLRGGSIASPEQIAKKGDGIRAAYGARGIDIRPDPDRPAVTLMDIVTRDPFASVVKVADLPPVPEKQRGGVVVATGIDSWGGGVTRDLRLPTLLVGGKGSGKSSEVWVCIERLLALGIPFRLRVFDPKGGVEFADLHDVAYVYERDATRWPEFLGAVLGGMERRLDVMQKRGIRKLTAEHFTEAEPFDLTIIDELLTVAAFSDKRTKVNFRNRKISTEDAWTKIFLSQCRAAGYSVLACTQLSQKSGVGDMRDMFDYTTVLRVPSDDIVRAVGYDPALCPAHMIPAGEKYAGQGYQMTEQGPVKYRAAYLNDRERAAVAKRVGVMTMKTGGPKQ